LIITVIQREINMKVILRKDVEKLGKARDLLDVSEGHARNYLLPKNLAYIATPGNIKKLEDEKHREETAKERELQAVHDLKTKMEGVSCTVVRKSEQENRLYGSVLAPDIAEALVAKGFEVDKKQVELIEPIREFGIYTVPVRLGPDIVAQVKVWVVKE